MTFVVYSRSLMFFVNEEDSDGCVLREYIWEARR